MESGGILFLAPLLKEKKGDEICINVFVSLLIVTAQRKKGQNMRIHLVAGVLQHFIFCGSPMHKSVEGFDGGRMYYTGGGHTDEAYDEVAFKAHLESVMRWLME